jgi:hypothetical protein
MDTMRDLPPILPGQQLRGESENRKGQSANAGAVQVVAGAGSLLQMGSDVSGVKILGKLATGAIG